MTLSNRMIKGILFFTCFLLASVQTWAQTITFNEAAGWLESAYVKWLPVNGAKNYNVYYSGEGKFDQKIDDQLIRKYNTYYRADVLGLKAGTYTIKVVPVVSGKEGEGAVTGNLTVEAHDRTGFAFMNGRVPGAYKADGTPKENAVILYITENSKNKVSMDVSGANANPCVGLQTILDGFKKGKDTRPLIVRLVGQITDPESLLAGDIVLENANNASAFITMEGVGDDAVADGWGIRVKNASNIEIRNIGSMNCNSVEGDDIGLQQENECIWVHHCDFFYGNAGSDADQIKGDGALDCKKSTYVTFSYNHFWDNGKCNLLGLSEGTTEGLFITFHHNWYDHSDSRHPRVRYYSAHVFNNYYDGNAKYGVGSTMGSSVFVEANYFRNCKYPMLTSMQGSDVYNESTGSNDYTNMPTFSKEDGGTIKAFNNSMSGQHRFVAYRAAGYPNSTVDFDAYLATSRDEKISNSVVSAYGSNSYNNFDTNASVMYAYTVDTPEAARGKVMQYAGRTNGGDFKWTFNNAVDDASSDVHTALKAALTGYKTSLVLVQGDSIAGGGGGGEITPGDEVHNFTLSGTSSTFYAITGNLSTSKGTVTYSGLTLTQCLKIESGTVISFTTTKEGTLTLVFNTDFSGNIKMNGTSYPVTAGILTKTIPAGTYQLTKGDTSNLYYMSIDFSTSVIKNIEMPEPVLYPNPVINNLFLLSGLAIKKVEIYSLTGALLKSVGPNVKMIDMSRLNPGSYLVKVYTEKGLFKQKIVKK